MASLIRPGSILPGLILHGGAGTIKEAERSAYEAGLSAALSAGFETLKAKDAVQAVLRAVTLMEDYTEAFNAGTGGVLNREGVVECDACVMDSRSRSGAVAALTNAKNPVLIADKVRTHSPHTLIVGAGANALVDTKIANEALITERSKAQFERWRAKGSADPVGSATVGAVALDSSGALAAATSTGGLIGKWPGRVGDSPIVGAGTYATPHAAISCTGSGEAFSRALSAKEIALGVEHGEDLQALLNQVLENVKTYGGDGGLITVTSAGRLAIGWNAPNMAYAYKTPESEKIAVGLEPSVLIM